MSWLFFAILSPAILTVVNFIDKYVVEREVADARGLVVIIAVLGFVAGLLFWIFGGFPILPLKDALLIMFSGMLTVTGAVLYFNAIAKESASDIIVFLQLTPIMVLALSFIFLRETLTAGQVLGFVLILAAALGVSVKGNVRAFHFSPAFFLILGVDILNATALVLFKFVSENRSLAEIVSYESWGVALGGVLYYLFSPTIRQAFHKDVAAFRKRGVAAVLFNEALFITAKMLGFVAVSLGPAALVSVLGSSQVFYGILLGWMLTLIAPAIFREDISRANLIRKGVLAGVLFTGIVMVS